MQYPHYQNTANPSFVLNPTLLSLQENHENYGSEFSPDLAQHFSSPFMSTDGSINSPFMNDDLFLEQYVNQTQIQSQQNVNQMQEIDLSWLSHNSQSTEFPVVQLNHHNQSSNMPSLQPSSLSYLHPQSTHPVSNDLHDLLNSSTAHNCQQLLEDPIKRKPGRKPKGMPGSSMLNSHTSPDQEFATTIMNGVEVHDKKEERKFKNREAADQSRKRLKDRSSALEEYTARLTSENDALRLHLQSLEQIEEKENTVKVVGLGMDLN